MTPNEQDTLMRIIDDVQRSNGVVVIGVRFEALRTCDRAQALPCPGLVLQHFEVQKAGSAA